MPTALKLATGVGSHHKLNADEPVLPPPTSLRPPKGLKPRARVEWKRLADLLTDKGVLTEGDLHAFRQYCTMVGEIEEFEALIAKTGLEASVEAGYVRALKDVRAACSRQEARLGLDPSSRSAIKAMPVSKPDAAAEKRRRFFGKTA